MGDPLGAVMSIASILKRAYAFYDACKNAPTEFKNAARHVSGMALVVELVNAELIQNKRSVLHQGTATSKAKISKLKSLMRTCSDDLQKLERLFKEYQRSMVGWAMGGKQKVIDAQADLMTSITSLNTFMAGQTLDVLGRMENMMWEMMKRMQLGPQPTTRADLERKRKLAGTLIASRFICRMKRAMSMKKRTAAAKKTTTATRPKLKTAMSWKTKPNIKKRETLIGDFVRTSLKDPGYGGGASTSSTEYFECWQVRKASTPLTPGVYKAFPHKRGQPELKEMAKTFQMARGRRAIAENDGGVKHLLRLKKKNSQHNWEFVAGRIECETASGAIMNRRDMVIVRRSRRR
jgi:hypothetical protein